MKPDKEQHTDSSDCVCQYCRLRKPFTLPEAVVADCHAGRLAIFAGAGISTEGRGVLPRTFYQDICASLAVDPEKAKPFPDVMSAFVARPNGRRLLLRKIRDRLAYVHSFAEIYGNATRFHSELATLYLADVIVTTNWDDYFERECGATPFVAPEDFAFWDVPGRKVFKLHGSVNSYSSLVATRPDYEACFERMSLPYCLPHCHDTSVIAQSTRSCERAKG
jgi:NAD-dependent SIR2 family protein deacetylase